MRIIIRLIVVALFLSLAGLVIPVFINFNPYKEQISAAVKAATGRDLIIDGNITATLLPSPKVTLRDIEFVNLDDEEDPLVLAQTCEIHLGFFSLLGGKLIPSTLTFKNAEVNLIMAEDDTNWGMKKSEGADHFPLKEITFINSDFSLQKDDEVVLENVSDIDAVLEIDALNGPYQLKGVMAGEAGNINFSGALKPDKQGGAALELTMVSKSFTMNFKGASSLAPSGENLQITGKITSKGQIKRLAAHYLMPLDEAFSAIKTNDMLEMTADVSSAGEEFVIDNIALNADSLHASGNIKVSFENLPLYDVNLKVATLDIDRLMKEPVVLDKKGKQIAATDPVVTTHNRQKDNPVMTFLTKNINALLYLEIDEMTLHDEKITKSVINAELFNGLLEIYPSVALLPGNVPVEVSGSISDNKIRPIFEGKISVVGDDLQEVLEWMAPESDFSAEMLARRFSFKTQVAVTPKEVRILSLNGMIDKTDIAGSMSFRHGGSVPAFVGTVTASHLNLDELGVPNQIYESIIIPLTEQMENTYLSSFQWLRGVKYKLSIDTRVSDVVLNKQPLKAIAGNVLIENGLLKIDKLMVDSKQAAFDANVELDMRSLWPNLILDVKGSHVDTEIFRQFVPPAPDVSKELPAIAPAKPVAAAYWSTEPFEFLRLDKFKGKITVALNSYVFKKLTIQNMTAALEMDGSLLKINQFTGDMFGGTLTGKGAMTVGIQLPSLSAVFSFANFKIEEFLPFADLGSVAGYMSISGSIRTQGSSPSMWVERGQCDLSMAAREVTISNMDVHRLIESTMAMKPYQAGDFETLVRYASTEGETALANVDGRLKVGDGIMTISDLAFDSHRIKGILAGSIGIKHWLINAASNIAFIPVKKAAPLVIGVRIKGALDAPVKTWDTTALETYVKQNPAP